VGVFPSRRNPNRGYPVKPMQVRVDEGVHGGHNALLVLACSWRHLGEKVRFQGVLFVVLESIGN
jgi:hypothetical protein